MCEYCGCRDIALIGRLSEEHYQAVDNLGLLRRAIDSGDESAVLSALRAFADELIPHNLSEEAGLFHELAKDDYFAPTVAELIEQHHLFRTLIAQIERGDWSAYVQLEETLRHHIDREENGLYPATAVAVDGPTWEEIDRLTHEFNHAHHREHFHTEAELQLAQRAGATTSPLVDDQPSRPAASASGAPSATAPAASTPASPVVEMNGESFSIRRMTTQDAAQLAALWRQTQLGAFEPEQIGAEVAGVARIEPSLMLVAVAGDSIVGSVLGTWDGRRVWVNRLATRPDWQGRDVATALLAAVEEAARTLGAPKINLLIEADNYGVVGFYEKAGYTTDDLIFMERLLAPSDGARPRC